MKGKTYLAALSAHPPEHVVPGSSPDMVHFLALGFISQVQPVRAAGPPRYMR